MWRRTPWRMSLTTAGESAFLRALFTSTVRAGSEGGNRASGGSLTAIELARMPLTRQQGFFRGLGSAGGGGKAGRKSDLAMMRRRVSLGAPGSSLDTRLKQLTVF